MKKYLHIILLALCFPVAFAKGKLPEAVKREMFTFDTADHNLLLRVIADIETGNKHGLVGPCGERSVYQMTRAVWEQNTNLPWSRAGRSRMLDRKIAHAHLRWILENLKKEGAADRVERIFAAWHYGLSRAYITGSDYVERSANLYYAQLKNPIY